MLGEKLWAWICDASLLLASAEVSKLKNGIGFCDKFQSVGMGSQLAKKEQERSETEKLNKQMYLCRKVPLMVSFTAGVSISRVYRGPVTLTAH